jgi:hypothetical protein
MQQGAVCVDLVLVLTQKAMYYQLLSIHMTTSSNMASGKHVGEQDRGPRGRGLRLCACLLRPSLLVSHSLLLQRPMRPVQPSCKRWKPLLHVCLHRRYLCCTCCSACRAHPSPSGCCCCDAGRRRRKLELVLQLPLVC